MSGVGAFRPRVPSAVRKHARRDLAKKARASSTALGETFREQQVRAALNCKKKTDTSEIYFDSGKKPAG